MKRFFYTVFFFSLTLSSNVTRAEDIEIYFNATSAGGDASVRPNIMLILDSSGSMSTIVSGTQTRMTQMKTAMNQILNDMEDVNVGLMRFAGSEGGTVLFPISYIDAPASTVVSEPADVIPTYTYNISTGNYDTQETISTGAISLTGTDLNVPQIPAVYNFGTVTVKTAVSGDDAYEYLGNIFTTDVAAFWDTGNFIQGLHFGGITVPNSARIDSATLDLYGESTWTNATQVDIFGHAIDTSPVFVGDGIPSVDISTRTRTTASVNWIVPPVNAGTQVTSPDLSTIITEITSRAGWTSGNALSLLVPQATGNRIFHEYDTTADTNLHPTLKIDYATVATPAVTFITGLHFPEINIPQGATITNAKLTFTASGSDSGDGAVWTIQADNADNSAATTGTANNLSGRTKTTAQVAWTVPDMVAETTYATCASGNCTGSLISVVQEVVNRAGWCGGNGMTFLITGNTGNRNVYSFDQDSTKAAKLEITYDPTAGAGCYRATETAQINADYDDAEETIGGSQNGSVSRTDGDLDIAARMIGLRFNEIDVPKNATILSAYLQFNSDGVETAGNPTVTIKGQAADDPGTFQWWPSGNLSGRTKTTASVNWTVGDFTAANVWHTTSDIKTIVQEIVNRAGWASGNSMAFFLGTTSQTRPAESHDGDPNKSAKLIINYQSNAGTSAIKTVRDRLIELVNTMPTTDFTPIVETLYEAAHYWRGESVVYGKTPSFSNPKQVSHPGSYCTAAGSCNGATVNGSSPTTNEYGVTTTPTIIGSPTYINPFTSTLTCQSNYQVLLTDGEANSNSLTTSSTINFLTSSCASSGTNRGTFTNDEICGYDIVEFLQDNDQNSSLSNDQTVSTYTVGFNTTGLADAVNYLKDLAEVGNGTFSEATTASDLVSVFSAILSDVKKDPTSFVAPSLATNAFNRLLSRDEVYFGLFTPGFEQSWPGNVKKYNICVSSGGDDENITTTGDNCTLGNILDGRDPKEPAIDEVTNKFKDSAMSEWSYPVVDGRETVKGGAGGEITNYETRILYTEATPTGVAPASGTSLGKGDNLGYQIDKDTWDDTGATGLDHVRALVCPTPSTTSPSDCEDRMLWLLGKIYEADADTDTSATTRWSVNDVLHSSPAVITYGGASDDDGDGVLNETGDDAAIEVFFDRLVVGTNDGGLRFINGTTGAEEWEFLPRSVLEQLKSHFTNAEGDHLYGLDVTPTIRVIDNNNNGIIEPENATGKNDRVYVYMAMRRGGNFIYAVDVTPAATLTNNTTAIVPKFLWRIQGGTGSFTRMADTWSQPRLARIGITISNKVVPTDVLIFGGGYDIGLDELDNGGAGPDRNFGLEGGAPNNGNAVYIVNADTGALVLSISHKADASKGVASGSGAHIEVPDMFYSIPSRITILDPEGDGLDNRLYFGDTAGQVWRVDLADDIKLSGTIQGSTLVGRLANLSTPGTVADERRFFEAPAVVQVLDTIYSNATDGEYDYVLIGSGNRSNPLNKTVSDRFYALRDKFIDGMPAGLNNLADSTQYPNGGSGVITNSNLIDITNTVLDSANAAHVQSLGWYLDFDTLGTDGEKVLSAATAIAGGVFFTTYEPEGGVGADLCAANIGGGAAYNLNILTTKAQVDWDEDGTLEDTVDRRTSLGGGIPSDVVPVFTKEGVVGIVGIEGGAAQLGTLTGLPRYPTYWYEEP